MLSGFGGRAGFDMNTCHIFPQAVLSVLTLAGGGVGNGVARARATYEVELLLCSVAIITYQG